MLCTVSSLENPEAHFARPKSKCTIMDSDPHDILAGWFRAAGLGLHFIPSSPVRIASERIVRIPSGLFKTNYQQENTTDGVSRFQNWIAGALVMCISHQIRDQECSQARDHLECQSIIDCGNCSIDISHPVILVLSSHSNCGCKKIMT